MSKRQEQGDDSYEHDATRQYSTVDILKLTALVAFFLAVGAAAKDFRCLFYATASISLFLAERFSTSKRSEFFFLVGLPSIVFTFVGIVYSVVVPPFGRLPMWEGVGALIATILLVGALSVIASAMSVVAVCIVCAVFHRLTGIQLLKYKWNDDLKADGGTPSVG